MSSTPITAELREFADEIYVRAGYGAPYGPSSENEELYAIADRIDAEHERRMDDRVEVVRCRDCAYCQRHVDGSHVCELTHFAHRGDYYCYFGYRREEEE